MTAIELSGEPVHQYRTTELCSTRKLRDAARALCIVALVWCGSSVPALAETPDVVSQTAYAHAAMRIEVSAGRRMNLVCSGSRDPALPTVVFDSGLSDWSFSWALVQPAIAKITRVCSFDRAGLGFSDPARRSGTSAHAVEDLHRLLQRAGIAPPYLLVGHSLGGLHMQLYAASYRHDISAMLLLDPVPSDGIARLDAIGAGAESRRLTAEVAHARGCRRDIAQGSVAAGWQSLCIEPDDARYSADINAARRAIAQSRTFQDAQLSETTNYANGVSLAQVREARRDYGALPLVVLSAARSDPVLDAEWQKMHRELAAQSSLGRHQTVPGSGHYLQLDAPQVVIESIVELLRLRGIRHPNTP